MPTSRVGSCSGVPSNIRLPRDGRISAPINFSSVDFPQPDGPTSVTNSLGLMERLTSSNATTRPPLDA